MFLKSLGLRHDSVGNNCNGSHNFIMEPYANENLPDDIHNSFLFSNCSLQSLNIPVYELTDDM